MGSFKHFCKRVFKAEKKRQHQILMSTGVCITTINTFDGINNESGASLSAPNYWNSGQWLQIV